MAEIIMIGEKKYPVDANALTPIIYSGAFRHVKEDGHTRMKDINDGLAEILDGLDSCSIPPFVSMAQFFWAFCKTADPNVSGFKTWLQCLPDEAFDMTLDDNWGKPVWEMIQANYFRAAAKVASEEAENAAAGAAAGA